MLSKEDFERFEIKECDICEKQELRLVNISYTKVGPRQINRKSYCHQSNNFRRWKPPCPDFELRHDLSYISKNGAIYIEKTGEFRPKSEIDNMKHVCIICPHWKNTSSNNGICQLGGKYEHGARYTSSLDICEEFFTYVSRNKRGKFRDDWLKHRGDSYLETERYIKYVKALESGHLHFEKVTISREILDKAKFGIISRVYVTDPIDDYYLMNIAYIFLKEKITILIKQGLLPISHNIKLDELFDVNNDYPNKNRFYIVCIELQLVIIIGDLYEASKPLDILLKNSEIREVWHFPFYNRTKEFSKLPHYTIERSPYVIMYQVSYL